MPMYASEIERLIRASIPDAEVAIRDLAGDPRAPLLFAAALCAVTVGCVAAFAVIRASASPEAAR